MERFSALIGFVLILAIAYLLSNNRKAIRWRTVFWGLLLQIIIAIAVLKGKDIAAFLSAIAIPIDRSIAALIFHRAGGHHLSDRDPTAGRVAAFPLVRLRRSYRSICF